ncbi:uncharacterized protein TNCV_2567751 [Trichonephila clavipes]|uniref:Uncharacterized protein n=1 Tax=Trichonephila clavipes TaxID=2585209 RepID=A0A8X7BMR4_TRICX|nr:uncharacterized protein TNCV_2567751 [Trichonephila clavipes]
MSASARARASQKYKSRLSLERGGYGPHTGTLMSGAERARRFRERRKADAARNFSANLASTSTTGIPVLMDVTNEQTIDTSIESATGNSEILISVEVKQCKIIDVQRTNASNRYLKPIRLVYLAAFVIDFGSKET